MNITVKGLCFAYKSAVTQEKQALEQISADIEAGSITAVVGAAGSGKTTLIQHFNGLLEPGSGSVLVDGVDIFADRDALEKARKNIGMVFQFPEYQFFEESVFSEIAFGPRNMLFPESGVTGRVKRSLEMVGMNFEKFKDRSPFVLSGGEKRRVAIASILAMEPRILVMDEPTVGLDPVSARTVEQIMLNYCNDGKTVVFVSHNMDLVSRIAHKVIVLSNGEKMYEGSKHMLFSNESLVNEAGLILPEVYSYMKQLKQKGWDVNTDIYKIDDAKHEIHRFLSKNRTQNL